MYSDKLAVAIKHNGKILRENKDLVKLPFGSEFTVLVKNLNSRRVKFKLQIDGTDVLDGTEIIVNANSEVEMKRFIRNGNMDEGNAFKFIERTSAIEDGPRGIKIDDGIVRVEFCFEKEVPEVKTVIHNDIWWNRYYDRTYYPYYYPYLGDVYHSSCSAQSGHTLNAANATMRSSDSVKMKGMSNNTTFSGNLSQTASNSNESIKSFNSSFNEAGITVPGSKVEQKFNTVYGFNSEVQSYVITIRLAGKVGNEEVIAPVTVKTKQKCVTCGHMNKANAKFCSDCGTALQLV